MFTVSLGSQICLPCKVLSWGNSNPVIPGDMAVSWTKNGDRVLFDGNVGMRPGKSDLFFSSVRAFHAANYSCQLKSSGELKYLLQNPPSSILTYVLNVKSMFSFVLYLMIFYGQWQGKLTSFMIRI